MTESSKAVNSLLSQHRGSRPGGRCLLDLGRTPAAVLSVTIFAIIAINAARAQTIRDGNDFSLSIQSTAARTCIIFPESARDPAACAGLIFGARPPIDPARRDLAIGLIRFVDESAAAEARLAVDFVPDSHSAEPDNREAEAFAAQLERAFTHDNPGTKVRGGTSRLELREVAGLKVVRVVFDLDGLNSDDRSRMEHQIFYFAWAEGGLYSFMLSTGGEHAAAVDAIADDSALTLRVTHPARPSLLSPERRPQVAFFVCFVFAIYVVINLLWAWLRPEPRVTPPTSLPATTPSPSAQSSTFPHRRACVNPFCPQLAL